MTCFCSIAVGLNFLWVDPRSTWPCQLSLTDNDSISLHLFVPVLYIYMCVSLFAVLSHHCIDLPLWPCPHLEHIMASFGAFSDEQPGGFSSYHSGGGAAGEKVRGHFNINSISRMGILKIGPVFYLCLRIVLDDKNLISLLAKIILFSVCLSTLILDRS